MAPLLDKKATLVIARHTDSQVKNVARDANVKGVELRNVAAADS